MLIVFRLWYLKTMNLLIHCLVLTYFPQCYHELALWTVWATDFHISSAENTMDEIWAEFTRFEGHSLASLCNKKRLDHIDFFQTFSARLFLSSNFDRIFIKRERSKKSDAHYLFRVIKTNVPLHKSFQRRDVWYALREKRQQKTHLLILITAWRCPKRFLGSDSQFTQRAEPCCKCCNQIWTCVKFIFWIDEW